MSEPIRILQVVSGMERGGIENMLMNVFRKIDRNEVMFDFLIHAEKEAEFEKEIAALDGRIYRLPEKRSVKSFFSYMRELEKFFSAHGEYRIVHCHMNALSVFPLFAAKRAKVPVRIAHSHTTKSSGKQKAAVKSFLKLFINRFCNYRFACSEGAGRYLFGRRMLESGKVTVIKNGVDCERFAFDEEKRRSMKKALSLFDCDVVLCHAGRFDRYKNQSFVLEILNELKKSGVKAKAVLLGEGEDFEKVKAFSKKLSLEKSVIFPGVVSNVSDYLQAADVFVFPSLFEGLPLTLIEAQANGLSVFASSAVSAECNVCETVRFLPLEYGAKFWADEIKSAMPFERADNGKKIRKAGYDSAQGAEEIKNFYLEKWCL